MQLFNIQDTSTGQVFNQVFKPWVLYTYDNKTKTGYIHKLNEKEDIEEIYMAWQNQYRQAGFPSIADELFIMELPKDQTVIDNVFNNTGYIEKLHQQIIKEE